MARSQTTYQIFYGRKGKDAPMVYQAGTDIAPAKPTYYALPYVGSDGWSQVTPGTTTEKPVLWSCAGKWQDSIVWGVPARLNGKDAHTHVLYADSSPLADAPSEIASSVYFIKDGKLPITGNEQYILLECAVKTAHAQELYACIYALNLEVTHEWIGSRGENKTIEASTNYQKVTFLLKVSDLSKGYPIHFGFYHRDLGTTGGSSVSYEISLKNISVTLLENFNAHSGNYRGEYSSFLASGSENPLDYSWNKLQGSQGASLFFAGVWDPDIEYVSTRYRIDWVKYRRGGKWEFYERKEDDAYTVGTPPYSSSTSEINPGWKFIEEQQLKYVRSLITEEVRIINELGSIIAGANKDNIAFWSGAELPENANFWVDKNGRMHASNGEFSGNISGINGTFTTLQSTVGAINILLNQWGISINDNNNTRKYININPTQFIFSTIGGALDLSTRRFYTDYKDKLVLKLSGLPTSSDNAEIYANEVYIDAAGYLKIKQ
jgi:hypothetical protein